jgi:hypothetical protein
MEKERAMARTPIPAARRTAAAPVNPRSPVAAHRAAQASLLRSLKPAPSGFDPAKRYLIQLTRAIPAVPGDSDTMLRPSHLIEVSGAFAATIPLDAISGAQEV